MAVVRRDSFMRSVEKWFCTALCHIQQSRYKKSSAKKSHAKQILKYSDFVSATGRRVNKQPTIFNVLGFKQKTSGKDLNSVLLENGWVGPIYLTVLIPWQIDKLLHTTLQVQN